MRRAFPSLVAVLLAACGGASSAPPTRAPTPYPVGWERTALQTGPGPYLNAVLALEGFIEREMAEKDIPALAIALVRDSVTVWSASYGFADPESRRRADAGTAYRVGSVSKLFTDMAIMRLVEEGRVSLDEPVARWLPELSPSDDAGRATLRQLMTHRAGIVREPPVGHYFDATEPTLEATVASLAGTRAVYPPGQRTKYSNAGIAVVGRVLEAVTGEPFEEAVRRLVLEPAGIPGTAFRLTDELRPRVASGYMWAYDRDDWVAPEFELGMLPAGNLYATVDELARFLSVLFARGQGPGGPILRAETLETMWTVQFAPPSARSGFGLGFLIEDLDGRRMVGHGGWIYGFATEVRALPEEGLGVAVAATVDGTNSVATRIAEHALRSMLAAEAGAEPPVPVEPAPLPAGLADRLEGRYSSGERWVDLDEQGGALVLVDGRGGPRFPLQALGDTLVVDGRLAFGGRVLPLDERAIVMGGDTLRRDTVPLPPPAPERWRSLIGEYGWDHNVLYVLEGDGRLRLLIEWFFDEPLTEAAPDSFLLGDRGLYTGEDVAFRRGPGGEVTGVRVGGVLFPRRAVGPDAGVTFRIEPVRPVEELRRAALAAEPPPERGDFRRPDLVELRSLEPGIRYDIRYATMNNFMGAVFYTEPHAFLQRPAAEAVARAHRALGRHGYGLLIHDAYRPWHVTKMFWDATPDSLKIFVADPASGSRHNRGAAVDLTLYDLATGRPVLMPSGYDEFTDRSFADYPGGTGRQRWLRELLRDAMEAEGFAVYPAEWWHFDYGDWRRYPILNRTFDELETP